MNAQINPISGGGGASLRFIPRENKRRNYIDAMIWDIGNVLVKFDHTKACRALAEHTDMSADEISWTIFKKNSLLIEKHMTGRITSDNFFVEVCKVVGIKDALSFVEFTRMWGNIFEENVGARRLLECLRPGMKKCILTDSEPIHWSVVWQMPIIWINFPQTAIVRSFEQGVCKPNKRMYQEALKRLGIPEDEAFRVLYIEDREDCCVAFRKMGGKALQYDCTKMSIRGLEEGLRNAGVLRT